MYHNIEKLGPIEKELLFKALAAHFGAPGLELPKGVNVAKGVAYGVPPISTDNSVRLYGLTAEATTRLDDYLAGYGTGRMALDSLLDASLNEVERDTERDIRIRVAVDDCPFPDCQGHPTGADEEE